ncbi:NfeD family protein [Vreelandella jeotgali]|uniref:NfeD family protein n=1 Tax=Vreelandella jeotgali TaxID=553386 RepID=UPI00034CE774|nr:NfeD family protein [Halomonas jeotgali]
MLTETGALALSRPALITTGVVAVALVLWLAVRLVRQRRIAIRGGLEALRDARATALYGFGKRGHVQLRGERWRARSRTPVADGDVVRVVRVEGLTLYVAPAPSAARCSTETQSPTDT